MSTKKTTKSENTPWAPAQPYITDSLAQLQSGNSKGQAIIDANLGGVQAALARATQAATVPPAYQTAARDQLTKTINGDFIGSNPNTDHIAELIAKKTGAQYNSTFGAAGRAHGGLSALLSAQGVGDAVSSFYNDNYNTERQLQQQAIGMAPAFNQDEYTGVNNLIPAVTGAASAPGQIAGQYAGAVTGATSPYVQNTTTQKTSGLAPILSTGLGLAAQLGGAALTGGASAGLSGLLKSGAMGVTNGLARSFLG